MNWLNELRYTLRILAKNFRFTLLCVSVIFAGIAVVLPVYALIDNLALKTPSLSSGEEYVVFKKELVAGPPGTGTSYDAFHLQTFRAQATSFDGLYAWRPMTLTISDGDYAEGFSGSEIEPELLQRVQVQPLLGRLLVPEDRTGTPVALISYEVWQTYYSGREDILGHQSRINGEVRSIVGVMPENFGFPLAHRVWLPLALAAGANPGAGPEDLVIAGILADGISSAEANTEVGLLQAAILADWPEQYMHVRNSRVLPFVYFNVGGGGTNTPALLTILASIVLLVACNVGNLFVARGEERVQELAVRSALGATPARVAQSLLLESFVVCCAGLAAGWVWAALAMKYLEGMLVNIGAGALTEYFWWDLSLNGRMLAVSALAMTLVWLGGGGLPAWRISRTNLNELLNGGGKGLGDQGTTRLSRILVNTQLILGCVLLTVGIANFTMRFGEQMTSVDNSDSLYTGRFVLSGRLQADAEASQNFIDAFQQALSNQPGVDGAAITTAIPGYGAGFTTYGIEDEDLRVNNAWPSAYSAFVTRDYFDLVGVSIVEGRGFGVEDTGSGLPVAIVDQRLAERLWPGQPVVGKRIRMNPAGSDSTWLTIVGVAQPSIIEGTLPVGAAGMPVIYVPIQQALPAGRMSLLISAADPAFDYLNAIRRAVAAVDRDIPITNIQSLKSVEKLVADERAFTARALYAVILIAIYLTGAATYGLAARAAGRRRMETGVRMALGASPAACIRVFLRDGYNAVVYGLGIGGTLAVVVAYLMVAGNGDSTAAVRALIPTTVVLCFVMGALVLLANYFPARKIVAMEPADALRYE